MERITKDLVNQEKMLSLLEGVLLFAIMQMPFVVFLLRYGAETAIMVILYFLVLVALVTLVLFLYYAIQKVRKERKGIK